MNTIYCNFSDINYRENQDWLINYVKKYKIFDDTFAYKKEWLVTTDFYKENKNILDRSRLCGYALWKPYIILETFKNISENDIVVYMDCGDIPENNRQLDTFLKQYLKDNNQCFIDSRVNKNKQYTKRDCFVLMDCDSEKYWNDIQQEDGFLAFKKNQFTIDFINEWLFFCKNENIITDIPNICGSPNFPEFIDHRHDQSIISLLKTKYDIPTSQIPRNFLKMNVLYHKDGESYSNGTCNWSSMGEKQ